MSDAGAADARAMVPTFGLLQFCPEDLSSSPALSNAVADADASAMARERSAGSLAPTPAAEARTWDAEEVAALRAAVTRRKRAAHGRLDALQRIRWQLNEWHQRVIGRKRKVPDDGSGGSDAKQARTDGGAYTGQPVVVAPSSSPKPPAMRTLVLNNGSPAVEAMGAAAAMGPVGVPHGSSEMQYTQQQEELQLQQLQQRKSGDKRKRERRKKVRRSLLTSSSSAWLVRVVERWLVTGEGSDWYRRRGMRGRAARRAAAANPCLRSRCCTARQRRARRQRWQRRRRGHSNTRHPR